MLIRFNVGNFLSFDSVQEFSMIAGKVRSKSERLYADKNIKLLKFAAVFGANAAGKSNLVAAMGTASRIIAYDFPQDAISQYCKLNPENKVRPSHFEFEIMLDGRYYAYGFEIILSQQCITSEWLYEIMPTGRDKEIFVRDVVNGAYSFKGYFSDERLELRLGIYANDVKTDDSVLLLNILNQNKDSLYEDIPKAEILRSVYRWFSRRLDINFPDSPISDYSYFVSTDNFGQICSVLSSFGTGITEYKLTDTSMEKLSDRLSKKLLDSILQDFNKVEKKFDSQKDYVGMLRRGKKEFYILDKKDGVFRCRTIQFFHKDKNVLFSLSEESDGTVRLLDLLSVFFNRQSERVYVIDEIDRCLHPQLTYKFVNDYLRAAAEMNVQLIVTTHESRLLDFDLLRKDEIWFVDKPKSGASSVYSLDEYNERFDKKIDKAYLEGRYGGVPIFDSVFPLGDV